ncbi:flagellar hook protein FlgE [Nitrosomonas sp. ANs5]|uniref:flagellar hook protein FlgE n=1 Tax=Nitrosomonas sp. ANs5 TaxID=3423941 RepID=UPI003D32B7B5
MGFQHGLSGLKAASTKLEVVGNNIANVNVVGFKQSQAQFSDVFANSLGGASGSNHVGIGTRVSTIAQEFSQGNITMSNNPLDIAIAGKGFFRMNDNGAISYTRNGQFQLDKDGFLVNADNINVTGYPANANGQIITTAPANLQLSTAELTPQATQSFGLGVNLDSRTDVPAPLPAFDATNPATYANSTSGAIYDSLGNSHTLTFYFQKIDASAPPLVQSNWNVYAALNGDINDVELAGAAAGAPLPISFDGNGALTLPAAPIEVSVTLPPVLGANSPFNFKLDLTSSTQFGSQFGVNKMSQDGFTSGRLAGFSVGDDGVIQGNYTNGVNRAMGQVVLANFANPNGLRPLGRNQWVETGESGLPLVGVPLSGTLGALQSAAIEESNVDLTNELVSLITAQRVYQANAKTIQTQDTVLQTLVNI